MAHKKAYFPNLSKPKFSFLTITIVLLVIFVFEAIAAHYYMSAWSKRLIDSTFQSPLPDVAVAERKKTTDPNGFYSKQYDFSADWFTPNVPVWDKALGPFRGRENTSYLEVGAYEGRSVIWMLENILTDPTAKVTAIDIFDGPFKDKYFANIKLSGSSDKVTTITSYSQLALRKLPLESFDIIYIDGSHAKNDVLEDAVLSWRLLKEGGIFIFDDYRYAGCFSEEFGDQKDFPKIALDIFVQCFDKHFEVIHNDYQLILRRKYQNTEKK